nr:endolytic transglycosylase MltG [Enterococcus sp. CU12B]
MKNSTEEPLHSSHAKKETEDTMDRKEKKSRRSQRRKEDRVVGRIVTIVVLTLVIVGGVFGFSTYRYVTSSLKPLDASNKETVVVNIPSGSSNKAIGEILESDKIIKSGMVFNYYTKFNNLSNFQAGKYKMSPSMTLDEIGELLQNGGLAADQADARVTVPEGYDISQIAETVAKATGLDKKDFLTLMEDEKFFNSLLEKYPDLLTDASKAKGVRYRLEGYLFPATYDYYEGMSLEALVTEMVNTTNNVLANYYDKINASDLNVQEVLALASLVEKEGQSEEDRKKIAQVFFNRLKVDMPLQSDISILYALGEHKEMVYYKDLEVDSPYNLYKNTGYGPGPFNSPSEQAIDAVLNPIPNDYYYFVADIDTQKVYYAETLDEHNKLVEEYVNNRE